jgi:short-subunit dehydrogenase
MKNAKVILISGVSSGFGNVTAKYLAQKGCWVFGTSRTPEKVMLPHTETEKWPGSLEIIKMDVNYANSIREGIKKIIEKTGRLDVVVNNAGYSLAGSIEDTSLREAKDQFNTNFFGVHEVCRQVIPIMRKQQSGYIINISSLAGLVGLPFQALYSASKYAIEGYTEALRIEVKTFGIKVSLIEPGDFRTSLTEHRHITKGSQSDLVYQNRFKESLKAVEESERKGDSPEKIARLVERIINTDSPRLRYRIGPSSTLVGLKHFIPERIVETMITRYYSSNLK